MEFKQTRWRSLIAAMALALCTGIGYAWSVFQKPLMDRFGWTLKAVSIAFTLQVMLSTLAPVFLSRFQKVLGVRNYLRVGIGVYALGLFAAGFTSSIWYLYAVYGALVGLGIAMLYPTLIAYATGLFPDKTGMASGLLACAYGSGAVLWAPLATLLMNRLGAPAVFIALAAVFAAVMIPFSFLIRNVPSDYAAAFPKPQAGETRFLPAEDLAWRQMLRTPVFYALLTALTLGATAGLMIAGHASGMLQEILSLTPQRAAVFVGLFAAFNAAGRLFFGFISDRLGRYNVMLILFACVGLAMAAMAAASGGLFIASLFVVSMCYGGFTSMFSPVCADHFGMKHLAANYAFLYVAYGLAGFVGPQLAAAAKAAGNGYGAAFLTVAAMSALGILIVLALKRRMARRARLNRQTG